MAHAFSAPLRRYSAGRLPGGVPAKVRSLGYAEHADFGEFGHRVGLCEAGVKL